MSKYSSFEPDRSLICFNMCFDGERLLRFSRKYPIFRAVVLLLYFFRYVVNFLYSILSIFLRQFIVSVHPPAYFGLLITSIIVRSKSDIWICSLEYDMVVVPKYFFGIVCM